MGLALLRSQSLNVRNCFRYPNFGKVTFEPQPVTFCRVLCFYKGQKVSRFGITGVSFQKSCFSEQRKPRFITNLATLYCELQIDLLEVRSKRRRSEELNSVYRAQRGNPFHKHFVRRCAAIC
jgi:hypothetical protein